MEVLHPHCAGLDVHKDTVVTCVRHMVGGAVKREVRTFKTTTKDLMALSEWLSAEGCTHVAMEATGIYWKPVWHILADGEFKLMLANAAHVKNVATVSYCCILTLGSSMPRAMVPSTGFYRYWMLGEVKQTLPPRWSIIRNVLGWTG